MCYSLHVAVNVCINCSFLHLYFYLYAQKKIEMIQHKHPNQYMIKHTAKEHYLMNNDPLLSQRFLKALLLSLGIAYRFAFLAHVTSGA